MKMRIFCALVLVLLIVILLSMTGCVTASPKLKTTFRNTSNFNTLILTNDSGMVVDIYSSTNLTQWSYANTLGYGSSSMPINEDQASQFFRGQVVEVSYEVTWNPILDTNVAGVNVYSSSVPNQFTNKYTVMGQNATNIVVTIDSPSPVIYFTATTFNNAGWESSYAPVITIPLTGPTLLIQ